MAGFTATSCGNSFLTPHFKLKLDEVIHLMLNDQLRKDIDDGLLEKLLGFFQCGCSCDYLIELLETSLLPYFLETVLKSINENPEDLPSDIVSFGLRALGLILKKPGCFSHLEKLASLCTMVINHSKMSLMPSVQAALLFCLSCLTWDQHGRTLLAVNGSVDFVFKHLEANSCYVRKEAIEFYNNLLVNSAPDYNTVGFKQQLESVLELLLTSVKSKNGMYKESCALVLKTCIETCELYQFLLCSDQHLLDQLYCALETAAPESISDSMLNLIAVCHKYRNDCADQIRDGQDVANLLAKKGLICEAISLSTKILLFRECAEELFLLDDVKMIIQPILLLTEEGTDLFEEMTKMLDDEGLFKAALLTSLASLSKLASSLNVVSTTFALNVVCTILQSSIEDKNKDILSKIVKQKKILSLVYQLALEVVKGCGYPEVLLREKDKFLDCLIEVLEKSVDSKVVCDVLKLVYVLVQYHNIPESYLSDPVRRSKLASILQRRLFDHQWPVVDSCLQVMQAMAHILKDSEKAQVWKDVICSPVLCTAVWDIAFGSAAEGYVRASCISLLTSLYFNPTVFEDVMHHCNISSDSFVSMLCLSSQDPDIFIQRECISSLVQCLNFEHLESNARIFSTFVNSVHNSLDCQVKITVLEAWKLIRESHFSLLSLSESNIRSTLQFLCDVGYGFSFLYASADSDRTVRSVAAKELLALRQTLASTGISNLLLKCENNDSCGSLLSLSGHTIVSSPTVSREARDQAINDVLDMGTANQIRSIMRLADNEHEILATDQFSKNGTASCSLLQLWEAVWSQDIEAVLQISEKSSDVYVDNPEALLDDIIAAKVEPGLELQQEYQDADCY